MNYLLDVNVLVAWGWSEHADHLRVAKWIGALKTEPGSQLFTSAIPELGFVRVSVQLTAGRLSVAEASTTLAGMLESLGEHHAFVPDDVQASSSWPEWCASSSQTTDAHLFQLAVRNGHRLATLDEGIPGAFLIPS